MYHSLLLSRFLNLLTAILLGLGLSLAIISAVQAVPDPQGVQVSSAALPPAPPDVFAHLVSPHRLHLLVASDTYTPGIYAAPDGDWSAPGLVVNGAYTATQSFALRSVPVALFRTGVQDSLGQDVAWENAYFEDTLQNTLQDTLHHTVLTETQVISGALDGFDLLILPAFNASYIPQVVDTLGPVGLAALKQFVEQGGTVYAQGVGAYLLEAAGALPAGTVDLAHPLELPLEADDQGRLRVDDPASPLAFNWQGSQLWMLGDPALAAAAPLQVVASYTNTLGGAQPAILYGEIGQGRVVLVTGHPVSAAFPEQLPVFVNGMLAGMAERGELYGRAIQTYDPKVGPTMIPAYEAGVPVSATLCVAHLWQGVTLADAVVTERVQAGFTVDPASVTPAPASLEITSTGTNTSTLITWELGDLTGDPPACLSYIAYTERDALQPGLRTFSQGELTYADGPRQVSWAHPDFKLQAVLAARLAGEHDKEMDRFYHLPEEGIILDEFVFLENKEESFGYNLKAQRYIPLIVPIVGLEDQRQPLATDAGETVWVRNQFFMFENGDYPLPVGFTGYTQTLDIADWDGTTFVTMTTPGGYHIDPSARMKALVDGFFVTIPPTYTHAITVTADHKLLLPAARVGWDLGDFPGFWYEMPAIRYGIHSQELFGRAVSFTGDPQVDALVVDATGGSVYTGLGADPRIYRDYLAEVMIAPPIAPDTTGLTYQDVWSRTHELSLRAGFYDLFNFASCACGPGFGETHQRLNVTFGIKVDVDGDGVREKSITDFHGWSQAFNARGVMPTRVQGDLDILIKTRNLAQYTIGQNENVIDGGIFRGLGFTITPRNATWSDSYESTYSVLTDTFTLGGYEHLIFQQAIPVGGVDEILIHARLDATPRQLEGLLKLHDGVRFVYRQGYAGPMQYEVHDTHVQGVIGARSDAIIASQVNPAHLSTYSDTLFTSYALSDLYDRRIFDKDVFLQSWGYGKTAATTYVGGRDGRTLLYSLVNLGERTWLRVEVNNNSGVDWTNVQVASQPPAGISVTPLFTQSAPLPMWPDLPFLNVKDIPDTSFGIYYFELRIDLAAVDLQGRLVEIPFTFQAGGAPADFAIPAAKLGVRAADGAAPRYASGVSRDLRVSDALFLAFTPQQVRLLDQAHLDELWLSLEADKALTPRGTSAISYYQSLTSTVPFSFLDGALNFTAPLDALPDGDQRAGAAIYAVAWNAFTGTRATRYQVNAGAVLTSTDDFGMQWMAQAAPEFIEASGAALHTTYVVEGITRTLTHEPVDLLYAYESNQVEILFSVMNEGNDVAADTRVNISLARNVSAFTFPAQVSSMLNGLAWDVGDLAPGARRTVSVVFQVYAVPPLAPRYAAPGATPILWGYLPALNRSNAQFLNVYSGRMISAPVGDALRLPYGQIYGLIHFAYLPMVSRQGAADISIFVSSAVPVDQVTKVGEVFYTRQIIIPPGLPSGGHFYLSSLPDKIGAVMVDDRLVILLDGVEIFRHDFSSPTSPPAPAVVEIPFSSAQQWAGRTVTIEYRDVYGSKVESTPIWLIWVP